MVHNAPVCGRETRHQPHPTGLFLAWCEGDGRKRRFQGPRRCFSVLLTRSTHPFQRTQDDELVEDPLQSVRVLDVAIANSSLADGTVRLFLKKPRETLSRIIFSRIHHEPAKVVVAGQSDGMDERTETTLQKQCDTYHMGQSSWFSKERRALARSRALSSHARVILVEQTVGQRT